MIQSSRATFGILSPYLMRRSCSSSTSSIIQSLEMRRRSRKTPLTTRMTMPIGSKNSFSTSCSHSLSSTSLSSSKLTNTPSINQDINKNENNDETQQQDGKQLNPEMVTLEGINEKGNVMLQFFDEKKNWGKNRIQVGRSWTKDELRLRSNTDLHQLWYVLIKERNMLLTMREAYKDEQEYFPNEERIDKVEESMENLEEVVRERNRAYWELEIGESGERERYMRPNLLGKSEEYIEEEHIIPYEANTEYREKLRERYGTNHGPDVTEFLQLTNELHLKKMSLLKHIQMQKCVNVLKRFPNASDEALAEKFPLVDLDLIKHYHKIRGHHRNEQWDV